MKPRAIIRKRNFKSNPNCSESKVAAKSQKAEKRRRRTEHDFIMHRTARDNASQSSTNEWVWVSSGGPAHFSCLPADV